MVNSSTTAIVKVTRKVKPHVRRDIMKVPVWSAVALRHGEQIEEATPIKTMNQPLILPWCFSAMVSMYIGTCKPESWQGLPLYQTQQNTQGPRPGSVVVERSPSMREVGGSIPGHVKQKTLKFKVLLLCFALSTKELETVWPARSQNNGLVGTSLLTRGVVFQWASTIKTGRRSD